MTTAALMVETLALGVLCNGLVCLAVWLAYLRPGVRTLQTQ